MSRASLWNRYKIEHPGGPLKWPAVTVDALRDALSPELSSDDSLDDLEWDTGAL